MSRAAALLERILKVSEFLRSQIQLDPKKPIPQDMQNFLKKNARKIFNSGNITFISHAADGKVWVSNGRADAYVELEVDMDGEYQIVSIILD